MRFSNSLTPITYGKRNYTITIFPFFVNNIFLLLIIFFHDIMRSTSSLGREGGEAEREENIRERERERERGKTNSFYIFFLEGGGVFIPWTIPFYNPSNKSSSILPNPKSNTKWFNLPHSTQLTKFHLKLINIRICNWCLTNTLCMLFSVLNVFWSPFHSWCETSDNCC